ncbi:cupin domain-containing protein [Niastella vici]|uniref:DUF4974 domain-containing protein n=1 Tax=Niastella vici TaxID=1703345 RepID=UPI00117D6145|nr:DUF4974 domain-containing protein [Niastella vici]
MKKISLILPNDHTEMPVWKYGIGNCPADTLSLMSFFHKKQLTGDDTLFYFLGAGPSEQYLLPFETGTEILLNAGSFLQFASINEGKKKLIIRGELYVATGNDSVSIEVEGSIVKAGSGTKLNIFNYPDEPIIISCIEGLVEIKYQGSVGLLPQYTEAYINKSGLHLSTKKSHAKKACEWVYGKMEAPDLPSALKRILRWYDYPIFFNNRDVENGRVVEFPYRITPVDEMLSIYQRANPGLEFQIHKGKIIVTKIKSTYFEEQSIHFQSGTTSDDP